MNIADEIPSRATLLKALDPRTEDGLPVLATWMGFFAILASVVFVFNTLPAIVGWNPIGWFISILPGFLGRAIMGAFAVVGVAAGLASVLAFVKLLHLLNGWRQESSGDGGVATDNRKRNLAKDL
jgi:hypothetical protein